MLIKNIRVLIRHQSPYLASVRKFAHVAKSNSFVQPSLEKKEPDVIIEDNKHIGTILLNRPKMLNAFNTETVKTMSHAIKEWNNSEKVDMILFKGKGRALCSGGDLRFFAEASKHPSKWHELEEFLDVYYHMLHDVATMDIPMISIMNGIAMGGGLTICAASQFSIATENCKAAMPETRIGHFCDAGASYFLSRLNNNIGKYMALCAHTLKAEDILFSGLATHFVPSDRLQFLEERLRNLAKPSLDAINDTIESFSVDPGHYFPHSYTLSGENRQIINECFKHNTVEEIIDALEENGSPFCMDTIKEMRKGCPAGIKLTLEQIQRGSQLSLSQNLNMELKSWQISPYQSDFQEGISSTLTKTPPKWKKTNFNEVDIEKDIRQKYFDPSTKSRHKLFINDRHHHRNLIHQKYRLPSEAEIRQVLSNLKTKEDVVSYFVKTRNNKYGVEKEVEEVLKCV